MNLTLDITDDSDDEDNLLVSVNSVGKHIKHKKQKDPLQTRRMRSINHEKELKKYQEQLFVSGKCPVFTEKEIIGSGAFGTTAKRNNQIHKIILNLVDPYLTVREPQWKWIFNRYKHFCKDMIKYTDKTFALFPENFIDYNKKDCGNCFIKKKPALYFKMNLIKDSLKGDFKSLLQKKKFTNKQLTLIYAQIYYICMKTNMEKLYHNDLKPANIMIKYSDKDFTYNNLIQNDRRLILYIKKGDPVPVFIDYDFISFKHLEEDLGFYSFPVDGSSSDDFGYFSYKTRNYLKRMNKKGKDRLNRILLLNPISKFYQPEATFLTFYKEGLKPIKRILLKSITKRRPSDTNRESIVKLHSNPFKRSKSLETFNFKGGKQVRKHKGVDQKSGRLKKGYKYSGHKLKSGKPQIIKVNKTK